ncbi:hypothetical protein [Pseudomonas agarici]|uniref:hypothetical protein n=1 Tax=Pseudomonas agarici TaxID=46677 RepID=UPI0015A2327C|nr:hypothetical protein [Pseudomonas agarici]NWB92287.1 hypothetical protein [Pseudomonas agarici]
MSAINRYARLGSMVEPSPDLIRLYPGMNVYVLASDYDRVTAERDALQRLLNVADERVNQLEGLLRDINDAPGGSQFKRHIEAALNVSFQHLASGQKQRGS